VIMGLAAGLNLWSFEYLGKKISGKEWASLDVIDGPRGVDDRWLFSRQRGAHMERHVKEKCDEQEQCEALPG